MCVQATSFVFSLSSFFSSSTSSLGLVREEELHHLTVHWRQDASCSQEATLASWSSFERMISEPGVTWSKRAVERLRKSWVVEGPMTASSC